MNRPRQETLFTTLSEARFNFKDSIEEAIEQSSKDSIICPCCKHRHKIYKRSIDFNTALTLAYMFKAGGRIAVHVSKVQRKYGNINTGGYFAILRNWGLINESLSHEPKGGRQSGYWKVTEEGELFLKGKLQVPKYCHILKNECIGLSGEPVSITDCIPEDFDYKTMMEREGW